MVRRTGLSVENKQAVESLMDAYGSFVLRLMYAFTEDHDAAQAFYMEVFLQAYRRIAHSKRLIGDKEWLLNLSLTLLRSALEDPVELLESTQRQVADLDRRSLAVRLLEWERMSKSDRLSKSEDLMTSQDLENVQVPLLLRARTSRLLHATTAQVDAEIRHRGPNWTKYGMGVMGTLAVIAIAYGIYRPSVKPLSEGNARAIVTTDTASHLPATLQNLPVTVLGQFRLTKADASLALDHVSVNTSTLYLPELKSQPDTWPSIGVNAVSLAATGRTLDSVITKVGQIDLVPPLVPPSSVKNALSVGTLAWNIKKWDFTVTGEWGIAVVTWTSTQAETDSLTQVYALYLPSEKSSLVKSLATKAGTANYYTVSVGDGKVVIQTGIKSPTPGSPAVSLPLDVYTLNGTSPAHALDMARQVAAPFGLMMAPVVTGDTLVFQGIAGQPDPQNAVSATWYTFGWNGQLTTYVGPPIDGQPHWAVKGSGGTLWWVETTPDMTNRNDVQVLMGQLVAPGSGQQVAAQSLSQSVLGLRVTGQYVVWVQETADVPQLVVTQVQ